jgi:hypothetical protein
LDGRGSMDVFKKDELMKKNELELKRRELMILIDNFCLSSELVVSKAREFEDLSNEFYNLKDGAYWMQQSVKMAQLLKEVEIYCPIQYKNEIAKLLIVEG